MSDMSDDVGIGYRMTVEVVGPLLLREIRRLSAEVDRLTAWLEYMSVDDVHAQAALRGEDVPEL